MFGLSDDTDRRARRHAVGLVEGRREGEGGAQAPASIRPIRGSISVMQLAEELIDTPRHLSQHVGGFLITRSRLDEVVPVENAAMDERTVIEWDKDDLETLGS